MLHYIGHNPASLETDPNHWVGFDPRQHIAAAGKTGTGKTTALENYILTLAHAGDGVLVGDPHGPLVADVRRRLRRGEILDFSINQPVSLNFFAAAEPRLAIAAGWRFISS